MDCFGAERERVRSLAGFSIRIVCCRFLSVQSTPPKKNAWHFASSKAARSSLRGSSRALNAWYFLKWVHSGSKSGSYEGLPINPVHRFTTHFRGRLRFQMLVRYTLSPDDHLAWYDYTARVQSSGWLSLPFIGPLLSGHRRACFRRSIVAAGNRCALGERTIELSSSGIREFSSDFDFSTAWQDLAQAIITPQHLFLAHPSTNTHIIPLQYFESDVLRDSFVSFVRTHAPSSPLGE